MKKVKLTEDQELFLTTQSSFVVGTDGCEYYHMPFWYKKIEDGVYEIFSLYIGIPNELVDAINKIRETGVMPIKKETK